MGLHPPAKPVDPGAQVHVTSRDPDPVFEVIDASRRRRGTVFKQ